MCVLKSEGHWTFFRPQVNGMSDMISFVISLDMAEKITKRLGLCVTMGKNAMAGLIYIIFHVT